MKLNMTYYQGMRNISNYNKIMDYLYIGNIESLKDADNFSLIINCTKEIDCLDNTNCIRIPVHDDPSECDKMFHYLHELNVFERMNESITQRKPVLVHCFAGMQRSCAVVACYLVRQYNITPDKAVDFIKRQRPIAFHYRVNFMKTIQDIYNEQK
jgi:protein-tyrosine phosphatase